jgi:hypothetical protein
MIAVVADHDIGGKVLASGARTRLRDRLTHELLDIGRAGCAAVSGNRTLTNASYAAKFNN